MNSALILIAIFLSAPPALASDPACVKYIYADIAPTMGTNTSLPVYACRAVINNRAESCSRIGALDLKKMNDARDRALEKMWAFSRGLLAGYACQIGVSAAPLLMGQASTAGSALVGVDRSNAQTEMFQKARDNVLNGTREPGTMPSKNRGEIVDTRITRGCEWVRHKIEGNTPPKKIDERDAFNLGVDSALTHFSSSAAMTAVLSGDAKALEILHPDRNGSAYKEAVKKFHARIEAERERQAKLLEVVKKNAEAFYHFMKDATLTTIAFGTSRENVDDSVNLKCISDVQIKEVRGKLCELAKATGKMETYVPGDLFEEGRKAVPKKLEGLENETRAWINENCPGEVAQLPGILEKSVPGLPKESGIPGQ